MRATVPVETKVSPSLWQQATGDCYHTCAPMTGVTSQLQYNVALNLCMN